MFQKLQNNNFDFNSKIKVVLGISYNSTTAEICPHYRSTISGTYVGTGDNLGLFPHNLFCRGVTAKISQRLWATGQWHDLLGNSVQICTDGSKLYGTVGSGIFSESVGIIQSIRLPDHCSVFQAEVVAIQAEARIIGDERVSKRNVTTLSDTQAAIKPLSSNVMNSKTAYDCRR